MKSAWSARSDQGRGNPPRAECVDGGARRGADRTEARAARSSRGRRLEPRPCRSSVRPPRSLGARLVRVRSDAHSEVVASCQHERAIRIAAIRRLAEPMRRFVVGVASCPEVALPEPDLRFDVARGGRVLQLLSCALPEQGRCHKFRCVARRGHGGRPHVARRRPISPRVASTTSDSGPPGGRRRDLRYTDSATMSGASLRRLSGT